MTVAIISLSISKKLWDRAGIELATPGTALRHASVFKHATLPTAFRGLMSTFFDPDQLRPNVGLDTGPNRLPMLSAHAKQPRW